MNFSEEHFHNSETLAALDRAMLEFEQAGANPAGCHSAEYLVTHEFGHCLRHRLSGKRYAQWWMRSDKGCLGTNGARTYSEEFAEGFALIRQVPAHQWSPSVRRLCEMLREDGVL